MKKSYEVRVRLNRIYDIVVEAEGPSEAEDMVLAMDPEKIDREGDYFDGETEVDYVEEYVEEED